MPPPSRPRLHTNEPLSGDLNVPSWSRIQKSSGDDPDELMRALYDMLEALPEEAREEAVASILPVVAARYADDIGIAVPDRPYGSAGEKRVRPAGATPVERILWVLHDLGEKSSFAGGYNLGQAFRNKHHYDMRSDRSRFFGLDERTPPGLGRFYTSLGAWMEHGMHSGLSGMLVSGVGALLEREGFRPSHIGLVALPRKNDGTEWAIRFDEILYNHMAQVVGQHAASLEAGFPVTWQNVGELLEYLVQGVAGTDRKRVVFIAAEVALQLALENPADEAPDDYLAILQQILDYYITPLAEGARFTRALREWGVQREESTPEPTGYYESGVRSAHALIERALVMPRRRDLIAGASDVVYGAALVSAGAAQDFIPTWWAAVRNRIPVRLVTGARRLS